MSQPLVAHVHVRLLPSLPSHHRLTLRLSLQSLFFIRHLRVLPRAQARTTTTTTRQTHSTSPAPKAPSSLCPPRLPQPQPCSAPSEMLTSSSASRWRSSHPPLLLLYRCLIQLSVLVMGGEVALRAPLAALGGAGPSGRGRTAAGVELLHLEHGGPATCVADLGAGAAGADPSLAYGRRLLQVGHPLLVLAPCRPRPPGPLRSRLRTRRRPSRRWPPAGTVAPISDSGMMEGGIQVRSSWLQLNGGEVIVDEPRI